MNLYADQICAISTICKLLKCLKWKFDGNAETGFSSSADFPNIENNLGRSRNSWDIYMFIVNARLSTQYRIRKLWLNNEHLYSHNSVLPSNKNCSWLHVLTSALHLFAIISQNFVFYKSSCYIHLVEHSLTFVNLCNTKENFIWSAQIR